MKAAGGSTPGTTRASRSAPTLRASIEEYGRGIAGGLLFSLPLLYTMEMWWAGFVTHPLRLLLYVLVTFALLLAYNFYAGLRAGTSFVEIAVDSIEEMGIGIALAVFILWLLGRIHSGTTLDESSGKIIMEAMTVAIGVSVGTAQLGMSEDQGDGGEGTDQGKSSESSGEKNSDSKRSQTDAPDYLEQVALALCGAILIASNVAPTEEVVLLATESAPWHLLGIALFSFALCVGILHYSGFSGAKKYVASDGIFVAARGAITCYAVALAASLALCWFFGHFDGASFDIMVALSVVLAFPATLGASAGRLLLQSNSD
jgi:putative integral membrane protein (TIGR02587 family)